MATPKVPKGTKPGGNDTMSSSYQGWKETLERPGKGEQQKGGR